MDYRNNLNSINKIENLDNNTILYAHARLDNVMFGSLKNILKNDWYNNKNNHIIKLSTSKYSTLWQVFSIYHLKTTNDYIRVYFKSNDDFQQFLDKIQKRSYYEFNSPVKSSDKILTLSTCYHDDERMVMHAKLIKYSKK